MRVTKYVRSDGENWQMIRIRHSIHMASAQLDSLMLKNGWVKFNKLRNVFNNMRKQLAKQNPGRHWKDVKIPMKAAELNQLPTAVQPHVEPANEPTTLV